MVGGRHSVNWKLKCCSPSLRHLWQHKVLRVKTGQESVDYFRLPTQTGLLSGSVAISNTSWLFLKTYIYYGCVLLIPAPAAWRTQAIKRVLIAVVYIVFGSKLLLLFWSNYQRKNSLLRCSRCWNNGSPGRNCFPLNLTKAVESENLFKKPVAENEEIKDFVVRKK